MGKVEKALTSFIGFHELNCFIHMKPFLGNLFQFLSRTVVSNKFFRERAVRGNKTLEKVPGALPLALSLVFCFPANP
jgi:hypothetical protein